MTTIDEKCECEKDECEFVRGNTVVIEAKKDDCEIHADVLVKKERCVRVWGQVKDCDGMPVEGALVKLVREVCESGKTMLIGVAHTVTDCLGFYQFDICTRKKKGIYRIIVGKAATGRERFIPEAGECTVCDVPKDR
ncbi:MAG: hypothetical protein PHO15_11740 [Eubacteriales bacterium]|nr:hypothetical protein [Eubacteriales bacterium]